MPRIEDGLGSAARVFPCFLMAVRQHVYDCTKRRGSIIFNYSASGRAIVLKKWKCQGQLTATAAHHIGCKGHASPVNLATLRVIVGCTWGVELI